MSYEDARRRLLREMLLEATSEHLQRVPWKELTIGEVASSIGVGRAVIYREFGSRDGLRRALLAREQNTLSRRVRELVSEHDDDLARAVDAVFLHLRDTVVCHVSWGLRSRLPRAGEPAWSDLLLPARRALEATVPAVWPTVTPQRAQLLAEALVRLAISYVLWGHCDRAVDLSADVSRVLVPIAGIAARR